MMEEKNFKGAKVDGRSQGKDWRAEFTPEVRQKVVNKIGEHLKNHNHQMLPSSDPNFLNRLTRIATQFEDKTFRNAGTKDNYMRIIGRKMDPFGPIKSEACQTPGPCQTSSANDVSHSLEQNFMSQFPQQLVGNLVEQKMQPSMCSNIQREIPGSQSSENVGYQLQQQEFQDQIPKDKVQYTNFESFIQPDVHNFQAHQQQQHATSQTAQNLYSQPPSVLTQYCQSPFAQPSSHAVFQQNQQLNQQHDASEQRKWLTSQKNISQSFQQPLGQQRDVPGVQLQQKMVVSQSMILNSQLHPGPTHMRQQQGMVASEEKVQKIMQPVQQHPMLASQNQNGISQEVMQPRPQTVAAFPQQRNLADKQNLFQSQRSSARPPSARVESKSSTQLAKTGDCHDEAYQQFEDFKQQYGPHMNNIHKHLKSLLDKAADPEQVIKYKKQIIALEKMMAIFSLHGNQLANVCKEKLHQNQRGIEQFVYLYLKKNSSVEQQAELCLPSNGQLQICQATQNRNVKLQFPPSNLGLTNCSGSLSPTSSIQCRVPNSRPNPFSSLQNSSGVGLEQGNGPSILQVSAWKSGQNIVGEPENTNFSNNNVADVFISPSIHQTRLPQTLEQPMQKESIQHNKEQMLMQNIQTSVTPVKELYQPLVPTTIHQPSFSSPLKPQHSSAHIDQKTWTSASSPNPLTLSSTHITFPQADIQTQCYNQCPASGTPGISASPLLEEVAYPSSTSDITQPFQRLLQAVKSISPDALSAAVHDIGSVANVVDIVAGGVAGRHSGAVIGEDLVSETRCHLLERNFASQSICKREMECQLSAMAAGKDWQSIHWVSDSDSTATSRFKRLRNEPIKNLLDEIRHVNQRLVETVVDIDSTDEDGSTLSESSEGTIIRCSYSAVAKWRSFQSFSSSSMFPEISVRMLVPANYPNASPVILDGLAGEESEDLSKKVKWRFNTSLRKLSEPMSVMGIAETWDDSARAVLLDHVQPIGGECFSSRYGTWEKCLTV